MEQLITVDNYNGALQKPIGSGFTGTSTTTDVIKGVNLTGKTAIITGVYAGIGLETVKTFVLAGANVVVPARDAKKAAKNLNGIQNVTIEAMDLMDPDSIDAFAYNFLRTDRPLHILVNNAGIMWVPLQRNALTVDKFGYLTGRSLTTFKRDFKKTFQTTPQKWLTEKRLELAHYQIREKKRKPSEVYLEVGFENLSHFGYAFKKRFGYAPTELTERTQTLSS